MASLLRHVARRAVTPSATRSLSTSSVSRKDFVQDLYLKELKAYKPAPAAKDAHLGTVKTYSAPSAPKPPTAPTDLASELAAYDAQEPDIAQPTASKHAVEEGGVGGGANEFLSHLEADLPKEQHAH